MNEKDDILLEYLSETGSAEPYKVIHWNITEDRQTASFSIDTVRRRLRRLRDVGLVSKVYEKGAYHKITDEGRAYLRGELDAGDLDG